MELKQARAARGTARKARNLRFRITVLVYAGLTVLLRSTPAFAEIDLLSIKGLSLTEDQYIDRFDSC